MEKKIKCKYSMEYSEYLEDSRSLFKCEEKAVKDGYCIYHHPTFWESNQKIIETNINKKIRELVLKEEEILFIGYNLTHITLTDFIFIKKVLFLFSKFHKEVTFNNVTFSDKVDFSGASFNSEVSFIKCTFLDFSLFSKCVFNNEVMFQESLFTNRSLFTYAIFNERVEFFSVVFKSEAVFIEVKFVNFVSFSFSEFHSHAYFEDVRFQSGALFELSSFIKRVGFSGSSFSNVSFEGSEFYSEVDFSFCEFSSSATFHKVNFYPGFPLMDLNIDEYINFQNVMILKPEQFVFNNVDLSKFSFNGTDISRVKFDNIKWNSYGAGYSFYDHKILLYKKNDKYIYQYIHSKITNILSNDFYVEKNISELVKRIYGLYEKDESILVSKIKEVRDEISQGISKGEKYWIDHIRSHSLKSNLTPEDVLTTYRNLRENHDYYLRYEDSGKFFIGEMELQRIYTNMIERTILWLYKSLCFYGESYVRPLLYSLGIIIGCTTGNFLKVYIQNIQLNSVSKISFIFVTLFQSLLLSLGLFFQVYQDFSYPSIIIRLISLPLLGSLYISLRRRLERRIRH